MMAAAAIGLLMVLAVSACSSSSDADAARTSSTTAPSTTGTSTTAGRSTTTVATAPIAAPTATQARLVAARPVKVHVAPSYTKGTAAPLLVLLHGYGTTGDIQSAYLGMEVAADKAGMVYVHPDGTADATGKQFWNATDACCARVAGTDVDDSAYLEAVIAKVASQYDIDPRRVYVAGHSNGGFMSYRMACDHADTVAAIASLEGATFADPAACRPSEPVATLEIHGTGDHTIPYDGGSIGGHAFPGAEQTVKTWARYDGCSLTPDAPAPADHAIVADLPDATVTSYSKGCDKGGHAELWTQPQGVHIPVWTKTMSDQVVAWLMAHPKPA